jgi:hypothetical protein
VLGYDAFIDAIRAAHGNERAALAAVAAIGHRRQSPSPVD